MTSFYGLSKQELIDEISRLQKQVDDIQLKLSDQQKLVARESWLKDIYENVKEIIFYLDVEGEEKFRFQSVNPAFLKAIGANAGQVVGKLVNDVIPEPSLSIVLSNYRKAIKRQKSVQWKETTQYPTGIKTGAVTITPIFNNYGVCTNLIGTVYDITEPEKYESRINHLNLILKAIRNVNKLIIKEKDVDKLALGVCKNLIKDRGYNYAWIFLVNEKLQYLTSAEAGLGANFKAFVKLLKKNEIPECAQVAIVESKIIVIENKKVECNNCPTQGACKNDGAMSVPLKYEGRLFGVLTVSVKPEYVWDKEEHELFNEVAQDIAYALNNIEQEEKRKLAQDAMRESRARLIIAQQMWRMGDFWWDLITDKVIISEGLEDLLQYRKSDISSFEKLNSIIHHPDDKKKINQWFNDCIKANFGRLSPFEYRVVRGDGKVLHIRAMGIIERDKGISKRIIATILDITKRKKTEFALEESQQRYQRALEATSEAIWDWNLLTNEQYYSPRWFKLLGYDVEEFEWTAEQWKKLTHPDDYQKAKEVMNKAVLQGRGYSLEFRIKDKKGNWRWILNRGEITERDKNGKAIRMSGTNSDITERKLVEEKLSYQARLLGNVSDAVISTDNEFRILSWNKAAEQLYGWEENEVIGEFFSEVAKVNYGMLTRDQVVADFEEKGTWSGEVIHHHKDGREINIHTSVSTYFNWFDQKAGTVAINRDISARKRAEKALHKSEKRYQDIFNNSPVPLWEEDFSELILFMEEIKADGVTDLNTYFDANPQKVPECARKIKILDVNEAAIELHQAKSKEDLLGNLDKIFNENSMRTFRNELISVFNGEISFETEGEVKTLSGESRHVFLKLTINYDEKERYKAILATLDITERKLAENEIKKQTGYIRNLLKTTIDGYILADTRGQIIDVNSAYIKIIGYSREELLKMNINAIEAKLEPEQVKKRIKRILNEGGAQFETKHRHKNGRLIDLDVSISISHSPEEVIVAFVRDITKRKEIENELQESERKLNTLMSNLPGIAYRCKKVPNWTMEYVSEGCLKLTGYEVDEIINDNIIPFGQIIHPNDRKKVWEVVLEGVRDKKRFELEYRIITKSNQIKWVWERGMLIPNKVLKSEILEGFITDITDKKLGQEMIAESERKYRLLAENAVDIIWQMDLRLKFTYVSPSISNVFGYTPEEWVGSKLSHHASWKEFFKMARYALRAIKNYKEFNHIVFEAKMLKKDGTEIPVEISGRLILNKNGLPVGIQGSTRNIIERKLAEAEIISMDNKLKLAMSAAKEGLWEWNIKTDQIYHDDVILGMLGYTRKDLANNSKKGSWWIEQIHPEDKKYREKKFKQYLSGKTKEYNVDFRLKSKSGNYIWVQSIAKFIGDNGDNATIVGVHRDITEQKVSEELLREKENFLNTLINAIPIPLFYKDCNGKYLGINRAFEEFYGTSREKLIGRSALELNKSEETSIYHAKDLELLEKGGIQQYEIKVKDANGDLKDLILNKAVFYDNYGKVEGLIGTTMDITKLKNAENSILQRNRELLVAKESAERSERSLKEAQTIARLGNWELDLSTNLLKWSNEMYRIFGIEPLNFKESYEDFLDRIHLDDKDMVIQAFLEHLNNKEPFEVDFRIYLPNGYEKHVQQRCYSEYNEKGNTTKLYGTIQDITALKLIEEKLLKLNKELEHRVNERTSEIKKLSEAVIHSPSVVMITNPEGVVEYVNPKFTEISGYKVSEVVGRNPRILKSGFHDNGFYDNLWNTIKAGKVWKGELCNKKKNGEIFWEHTSISSIKTKDGQITHFVAVKEDITFRKEMEGELTKAKEEAEVANKAKSEFLANMSHEIRTPMNAVLGFADLLSNMVNDELQKNYLDSIKSSGKSLLTLINDILDLSKIEAGKLELQYSFVDLFDIFNEMKSIFSLISKEKGIEFIVEIESNVPLLVLIDEIRLRQVVINLLSNAFKFTSKGQVCLSAKAISTSKNDINNFCDLIIQVEDTGIGITKESQTIIFDSFSQQEGQSAKKYGGTGLGLTISQRLVNLMNGTIELQSKVNKGSVFNIVFKNIKYTYDKSEKREYSIININSVEFKGATILIVDDTSDNRKYLAGALMNYNLDVIQASNGREALELLKHEKPDLIITDLRMPDINGFELMDKLQKNRELKKIPVVATSASAMKNSVEKVKKANFSGFIVKPFQIKELIMELIKHLPYENIEKEELEEVINERINIDNIKEPVRILDHLEELNGLHHPLKDQQAMQDVEFFANKCIQFAKEFSIKVLIEYGEKLNSAVKNFDVELMLVLINKYNELQQELRKLVEDK